MCVCVCVCACVCVCVFETIRYFILIHIYVIFTLNTQTKTYAQRVCVQNTQSYNYKLGADL